MLRLLYVISILALHNQNIDFTNVKISNRSAYNQEALQPVRFLNFMNQNPEIDGSYFPIAENRNQISGLRKWEMGKPKAESRNPSVQRKAGMRHVT